MLSLWQLLYHAFCGLYHYETSNALASSTNIRNSPIIFGAMVIFYINLYAKPSPATGLMLLVLSGVYHFVLGLTMVVEDYVLHSKMRQIIIQTLNAFGLVAVVFGFVCIVQIIASGGRCS